MIEIKICGLSTPETIDAAVAAGANYVGFVFFPASPRNVVAEQAAALGRRVPAGVGRVGVFVDPDDALLDSAVGAGLGSAVGAGLDAIQLHGHETPERIAAVRRRFGLPVWRAIGVATRGDIDAAVAQAGVADRLLFDAKAPRGAALPGGNGLRFDWRLLDGAAPARAWGLSGGLDAGSVAAAVAAAHPPLIDVSSGVEDEPGVKSVAKIKAFIAAARRA